MKTCVVTMFFNLTRSPDSTSETRPLEFYMRHGGPTMSLPHFMIIFCDEDTLPILKNMRGDRPTQYVMRSIFDYDHVKSCLPIIRKNRGSDPYIDQRNTPTYLMLTCFKTYALHLAKGLVEAETYMWLDLGASHIVRGFPDAVSNIVENPRPKIAACYIHYRSHADLYPVTKFLERGGPCSIAATAYTVAADYVDKLYALSMSILYEHIADGVGHSDEQVFAYAYDRHPEWFSLYFGDYYSCLTNYHRAVEDRHTIEHCFIGPARYANRMDLVGEAQRFLALE